MKLSWPVFPKQDRDLPKVAVLLCTFNGDLYLKEQLESIASQTHRHIEIWISDDGSEDGTIDIIQSAQLAWGPDRIRLVSGPRQGFARNFLFLACHPKIKADYFAFCDQDDVWLPNKLRNALGKMGHLPGDHPLLYGGITRLIDATGQCLETRTPVPSQLGFSNALVQNFASGNTMLFNNALRGAVQRVGPEIDIVSHDWWLYIVATALNGSVVFDVEPNILYRQHKGNVIGAQANVTSRLQRLKAMSTGRAIQWLWCHRQCLKALAPEMPQENGELLRTLDTFHDAPFLTKVSSLPKLNLQRQSHWETQLLKAALLFSKPGSPTK